MNETTATPPAGRPKPPWWFRFIRAVLNLALLAVLALQVFLWVTLSIQRHLSVPDFVLHAIEENLQSEGVSVRFASLQITLTGEIWAETPSIYLAGTRDPVVQADWLAIEPKWLTLVFKREFDLDKVRLSNARLYCPPEVSPTGDRETLVSGFDVGLSQQGRDWWSLDYLRGQIFNVKLLAHGTFILPAAQLHGPAAAPGPTEKKPGAPTIAAQYRHWAREAQSLEPNFATITNPLINVTLEGAAPKSTRIRFFAMADAEKPPIPGLTVGRNWMRVSTLWDGRALHATSLAILWVEHAEFVQKTDDNEERQIINGGPLWVAAEPAQGLDGILTGRPTRVWFMACPVTVLGFQFDSLGAEWDFTQWPIMRTTNFASKDQYWVRTKGENNIDQRTTSMDFDTYVDPAVVLAAARLPIPPELSSLKFDQIPRLEGHFKLLPGYKPDYLDFILNAGGVHFDRINAYALRAQGRLTPTTLDIQSATVWNDNWRVRGAYFQNLQSQDFRILARGNIDPAVLTPYMGKWWPQIWNFVLPGEQMPTADVDYGGNWNNAVDNALFGSVGLVGGKARGVALDELNLRIFQRKGVVAVFDMVAQAQSGGRMTGTMMWLEKPPYKHLYEQRYLFAGNMLLPEAAALAGPAVEEMVRPISSPTGPLIRVDMRTGGEANPQPHVEVTKLSVYMPAPFRAWNVPLDSLSGEALLYDGFTDVPHLEIGLAGGLAQANMTMTRQPQGQELIFQVGLKGGHHTGVLAALADFDSKAGSGNSTGTTGNGTGAERVGMAGNTTVAGNTTARPAGAPSVWNDLSRPGNMDVSFGARVMLNDKTTFSAEGHARIYEAKLGQLHLFGGLSLLGIGSFDLDAAESDIQIANEYMRFPNLMLTGSSAKIGASGLYHIPGNTVNFQAKLSPTGQWNAPVISQVVNLFTGVTKTFTVRLTGTLDDPDWNLSNVNPFAMFSTLEVPACPPIPGFPSDAKGNPILPLLPDVPVVPAEKKAVAPIEPAPPAQPPPVNPTPMLLRRGGVWD